ncbi:NAD(P)/FAD-dependent oxidoreductase [Sphingosinicella sp. CPCC 101087]|uniref:NAD(P)/FAD-dependent oxidoreductase n=1 Tax=Sphingosinicella sp. CPCC 101087 TaxID=2497754 RepID=UPI00101DFE4E|nr:NAD(P)/FAD-dependent oxidoreductase [Sphingosinicella sp. CPCC 101087]
MERVDAIVVGAGVVGLAIARALALAGREVLILDRETRFGSWTSSRSSEVIHAGLYYPPGSLKAALCVEGRDLLYAFCRSRGVPHRRLGKLIFAHDAAHAPALDAIEACACRAGAGPLRRLSAAETKRLEPVLDATEALFSPMTGIVDSHAFMLALLGEAEAHRATLVCRAAVGRIGRRGDLWQVHLEGDEAGAPAVEAPVLVNSAGLAAQALAARIDALDPAHVPPLFLARGVYFTYSGRTPFRHLIYPVPEPGGLGTHLTLDLAGKARFGPDVEWVDSVDYRVDPARRERFAAAARRIWADLDPGRLEPGYAGIRPKLSGPGGPPSDFVISGPAEHGLAGLVGLFGIESPGLTAALAIAARVERMVR